MERVVKGNLTDEFHLGETERGDDVFRKVKVKRNVSVSKPKMEVRAYEQQQKYERNSSDIRTH